MPDGTRVGYRCHALISVGRSLCFQSLPTFCPVQDAKVIRMLTSVAFCGIQSEPKDSGNIDLVIR